MNSIKSPLHLLSNALCKWVRTKLSAYCMSARRRFQSFQWDFPPNHCRGMLWKVHTHTEKVNERHFSFRTRQLSLIGIVLTASSVLACLDRCHPAWSKSCSAEPWKSVRQCKKVHFPSMFRGTFNLNCWINWKCS